MTDKEYQQHKELIKRHKKRMKDPEYAKGFFQRLGILDEDGELTEHGKNVGEALALKEPFPYVKRP